ncbi:hypothetical protein OV090_28165 [Nannocystis sp. RBIL2]|uniref:hypothetical protein n=1 Tax=Nannocystis sp. RBIL2 TaxID=2996788 RepID=UPI002270E5FF|nr:hypothetical protein [Nannocystis sp. RBIL2]MCY1068647.1 hypothetical protein [Nannocystis sp. RBIL2]
MFRVPSSDPVPSGTPLTPHSEPVPSDAPLSPRSESAPSDSLAETRESLLAAYRALLDRIRDLAPGDRSDRVAQLAEAAAALVEGEFARRLVFDAHRE